MGFRFEIFSLQFLLRESWRMAFYKVFGLSIFFSNEPAADYMMKYVSVLYRLEGKRYIKLFFMHSQNACKNFEPIPAFVKLPVDTFAKLVPGVSTTLTEPVSFHNIKTK